MGAEPCEGCEELEELPLGLLPRTSRGGATGLAAAAAASPAPSLAVAEGRER